MVPVGGEETPPVKETLREKDQRVWQEALTAKVKEAESLIEEIKQVSQEFLARGRKTTAKILDDDEFQKIVVGGVRSDGVFDDDFGIDLLEIEVTEKTSKKSTYVSPIIGSPGSQSPYTVLTDGAVHQINYHNLKSAGTGMIKTVSEVDKNGQRHPLIQGIDQDVGVSKNLDDQLMIGTEGTKLSDGRVVRVSRTNLSAQHEPKFVRIGLEMEKQTLGLAKKLVTGEPVIKI